MADERNSSVAGAGVNAPNGSVVPESRREESRSHHYHQPPHQQQHHNHHHQQQQQQHGASSSTAAAAAAAPPPQRHRGTTAANHPPHPTQQQQQRQVAPHAAGTYQYSPADKAVIDALLAPYPSAIQRLREHLQQSPTPDSRALALSESAEDQYMALKAENSNLRNQLRALEEQAQQIPFGRRVSLLARGTAAASGSNDDGPAAPRRWVHGFSRADILAENEYVHGASSGDDQLPPPPPQQQQPSHEGAQPVENEDAEVTAITNHDRTNSPTALDPLGHQQQQPSSAPPAVSEVSESQQQRALASPPYGTYGMEVVADGGGAGGGNLGEHDTAAAFEAAATASFQPIPATDASVKNSHTQAEDPDNKEDGTEEATEEEGVTENQSNCPPSHQEEQEESHGNHEADEAAEASNEDESSSFEWKIIPRPSADHPVVALLGKISDYICSDAGEKLITELVEKRVAGIREIRSKRFEVYFKADDGPTAAIDEIFNAVLHQNQAPLTQYKTPSQVRAAIVGYVKQHSGNPAHFIFENFSLVISLGASAAQIKHADVSPPSVQVGLALTEAPATLVYKTLPRITTAEEFKSAVCPKLPKAIVKILEANPECCTLFQNYGNVLHPEPLLVNNEQMMRTGDVSTMGSNTVHAGPAWQASRVVLFCSARPELDKHGNRVDPYVPDVQFTNNSLLATITAAAYDSLKKSHRVFLLTMLAKEISSLVKGSAEPEDLASFIGDPTMSTYDFDCLDAIAAIQYYSPYDLLSCLTVDFARSVQKYETSKYPKGGRTKFIQKFAAKPRVVSHH